jgi:benzodiazapine receptor
MDPINAKKLAISIGVCLLAGVVGSVFTADSIPTWFAGINKPGFSPPNWLFGPVWTLLYIMMGISAYLIWMKGWKKNEVKRALDVFGAQLILNLFWSIIFFGFRNPQYAFIEIIVLWIAIAYTIERFYRIEKRAAYLLIPYLMWVTFAAFLNYSIWILNP